MSKLSLGELGEIGAVDGNYYLNTGWTEPTKHDLELIRKEEKEKEDSQAKKLAELISIQTTLIYKKSKELLAFTKS
ncbi:MAG: hypothetical protein ABIG60_02285 [Patescibacteria group bacterium]